MPRFEVSRLTLAIALAGLAVSTPGVAATRPAAQDTPYPGTISLHVDATDTGQGIFRVHESIPVKPGMLTLLYPQWIPGDHSPTGPIAMLAGLRLTANGHALAWKRDEFDVYAFNVEIPAGVSSVDADFQYLSSRSDDASFEITDRMMDMAWSAMSLYPAGYYTRGITVAPSVTLPHGWQFGSALETASQAGDTVQFKPVSYENLVDSPIYAGRYFKRVDLAPGAAAPVHLDLVVDDPKQMEITPQQLQAHRALVTQAIKLFGSHHYDHYDFLLSLSDQLAGNGTEHHQSSENGRDVDYFTGWSGNATGRDLLAHEYTHSWNGKFRRPADLWTPDLNVPMGDSLLWVYEGQTQFWGYVLTARSGLWTKQQFLDALAMDVAKYERDRPGFAWRTMEDTTNDPTAARRRGLPFRNWQMSEEYYSGGALVWLAADAKLRALSGGRKSLDDFARAFFGVDDGSYVPKTYTFDDVVAALNGVAPYDWAGFLKGYVASLNPSLLDGVKASGWQLVYTDKKSEYEQQYDGRPQAARHLYNYAWSIGLSLNKDVVNDVVWDGPAFKAGISTGATVIAVNGREFSRDALDAAIAAAKGSRDPIRLTLKYQGAVREVAVDYHGGLQYPHLVRIDGTTDTLSQLVAPR
jgi:predicted metalloprotease with PDZ domain